MAKFILIDHSLRSVGGHHFEYAVHILREAHRAGYEIVLATHREFRGQGEFPKTWQVLALFHDDVYSNFAILTTSRRRQRRAKLGFPADKALEGIDTGKTDQPRSPTRETSGPSPRCPNSHQFGYPNRTRCWSAGTSTFPRGPWNPTALFATVRQFWRRVGFERRSKRFAEAWHALFRAVRPQPGDVVFAATFSAFDLQGLASFLAESPETELLDWHLQFHHSFLKGRETDYHDQTAVLRAMRKIFQQAQERIPNHRLQFHATTTQLASQYNRLEVGSFAELPYPVNLKFYRSATPSESRSPHKPLMLESSPARAQSVAGSRADEQVSPSRSLSITCAGGMRREKGSHQMATLIRELWDPYLATGQVRLRIQASRRSFQKVSQQLQQRRGGSHAEPLVRVPHPLGMEDYVRLIHSSDLGLFLYDSRIYYARCSGILAEMLAAGVPVIVPAGCWLANQIAEPIYRYLDGIHQQTTPISRLGMTELQWNRSWKGNGICIGSGHRGLQSQVPVPEQATGLMLRFRHKTALGHERYVQIRFAEHSHCGEYLDEQVMVLGQRPQAESPVSAFVGLNAATARVKLSLRNAYGGGEIEITDLECSFLPADGARGKNLPIAAVGVIASDLTQIPRLLAETIDHYDHYRRTANAFAHEWMNKHAPRNTFTMLMARAGDARNDPLRAA